MDGTIVDSPLDFDAIREEIGLRPGVDILQSIEAMEGKGRERARAVLHRHEIKAAGQARLLKGAREVLDELAARDIKPGLLTRNSAESARRITGSLGLRFDAVVTRDDGPPKPSPEGIYRIARELGVVPANTLMVGDYIFDVLTGKAAGARTVFIRNKHNPPPEADWVLEKLTDIISLIGE
jgi:HAD superfamily hydrolase (TIGR01549 family)